MDANRIPDFLILGAPRCGTTSLSNALSNHPKVYIPPIKEVGFFANETNWKKGVSWYESHFEAAESGVLLGDATPQYLQAQAAPERISCVCSEVRLLVMVRDPVKRARSHYWYRRWQGTESRPLRTAFEDELKRFPEWDEDDYLLPPGCYAEHLDRYVQVFGRRRLFVLSLERLSSCPEESLDEVQDFLNIPTSVSKLNKDNRSTAPRSRVYRNLVQSLVKSQGLAKQLLKRITTHATRHWLRRVLHTVNMKSRAKPPLPEDIEARLEEVYAPRRQALAERFNVDV